MISAASRQLPLLLRATKASRSINSLLLHHTASLDLSNYFVGQHQGTSQDVIHRWSSGQSIDVTVTKSDDNTNCNADDNQQTLSKSADQITEEELLSLQSTLRTHHRTANYSAALSTASELLTMSLAHFGKLHPATASAYNNVGLMNKCLGNYNEAKEAYEESLRIYGEVCGKDHGSYAAALSNLGMLERVRVLEVDEEEAETQENAIGDYNTPVDTNTKAKLTTLDRLQLNEIAIEYFDEAYRIRLAELGLTHPHTIASRSQLGSAMAYSVIMERRNKLSSAAGKGGLIEKELRDMKHQLSVNNEEEMEKHIPMAVARAASKSMATSSRLSRRRWDAAQEHLRGALETAVSDPRGESVRALQYLPGNGGATAGTGEDFLVKDRSLPKKDRKKAVKVAKREKKRAIANAIQQNKGEISQIAVQGAAGKVTTLSAATAAQNLAVFLKNFSDWQQLSLLDGDSNKEQKVLQLANNIKEARHLYEAALHVRSLLLPAHHPDVVATKFSLAELLDAPKEGLLASQASDNDEKSIRANALREEILAAYNVEERDDDTHVVTS